MGLDVYLYKGETQIELPSIKYPEHLFKIGYWRSSYNDGGINNVFRHAGLTTLGEIAGDKGQDYEFSPDWPAALERAKAAIVALDEYTKTPIAQYVAMDVAHNIFGAPTVRSEEQAMEVFQAELVGNMTRASIAGEKNYAYSNREGIFYTAALECCGFIPGWSSLKAPCTYVIYKRPVDSWDWYRQALEVVVETFEYVINTGELQAHCLHWNG